MPYRVRRQIKATGGVRTGTTSNYSDLAQTTGRITMAGTGRVYKDLWLPATQWYALEPDGFMNAWGTSMTAATCTHAVSPWQVNAGEAAASPYLLPALVASTAENLDARAWTTFFVPFDAADSGSVQCFLYWSTLDAQSTAGSMEVFRLHYNYWGTSGSAKGGSSGSIVYGASMATTGSGKLEVSDLGDIPSFQTGSPLGMLQLTLENSNASAKAAAPDEVIFGLRLRYVANSLGPASAE